MSSTNSVNFSLRPNKCIERLIVIERIVKVTGINRPIYIGFGSVWFSDFHLAHRLLGVEQMISIEEDDVVCQRARFNRPYHNVEIRLGKSSEVIPDLLADETLGRLPWVIWLDYDRALDETKVGELAELIAKAPENSIILSTFSAESGYGKPHQRASRLQALLGDVVPDNLTIDDCKGLQFNETLATAALEFLRTTATDVGRPGSFVPAFRVPYRDGTPMITVGGILPSASSAAAVREDVGSQDWPSLFSETVVVPPLTVREVLALQSLLPNPGGLKRQRVQELGFDLDQTSLDAFAQHFLRYPIFGQFAP